MQTQTTFFDELLRALPKLGPNMRRLAVSAATKRTMTLGGSPRGGLERLESGNHIFEDMVYGLQYARTAIHALRNEPDIPGEPNYMKYLTDEQIAGIVMNHIDALAAKGKLLVSPVLAFHQERFEQ